MGGWKEGRMFRTAEEDFNKNGSEGGRKEGRKQGREGVRHKFGINRMNGKEKCEFFDDECVGQIYLKL